MSDDPWYYENLDYLHQSIAHIRDQLNQHIARSRGQESPECTVDLNQLYHQAQAMTALPALEAVCSRFDLSPFERSILLLCVGQALVPDFPQLCAIAHNNPELSYPTFQLACQCFSELHWDALSHHRPLREWQLIHCASHPEYTWARLQIDEAILNYLLGSFYHDPLLADTIFPVHPEDFECQDLQSSHQRICQQIPAIFQTAATRPAVIQLCGAQRTVKGAIALQVVSQLQTSLYRLPTDLLPREQTQWSQIGRRWQRWMKMQPSLLMVEVKSTEMDNGQNFAARLDTLLQFINRPVFLLTEQRLALTHQRLITFDVVSLSYREQLDLWQEFSLDNSPGWHVILGQLASQFKLSAAMIQTASGAVGTAGHLSIEERRDRLWEFCRLQARPQLEALAQRIEVQATWDDLILPDREKSILRQITTHVQHQAKVYQAWGFAQKNKRGLGLTALFSGVSGTGKTTAAEILAHELKLDLFRIDLSSVVSKYIGETEKNLRHIFDAAEMGGVVLLFDEADALFGKRTQVKDSHDRHANIEVSYLLQRMEAYQGLAILTTNLKDNLDQAFLRRLRFVINFPYPKAPERSQIWRRVFPEQTPTEGLDFELLGQLDVTGGNIKAIALNAAFIAAEANESVQMKHILEATRTEYLKLGRSLTKAETQYWEVD